MNRVSILAGLILFFIITSCNKDSNNPDNPTGPIGKFGLSIEKISYSTFGNSPWEHVTGGVVSIEFGLKDANGAVTQNILDSVDLKNISAYKKDLAQGKYDVSITTKNPVILADTFLRFTAQLKSWNIESENAISLTSTSTDGLITISKHHVRNNSFPVFKSDGDPKPHKFGLIRDTYYLYVKGNTTGVLSFTAKSKNQPIDKTITVTPLVHHNYKVNSAGLDVETVPFEYLNPSLGTPLLSLKLNADAYAPYKSTYFVVTDENGTILNELKYIKGTTSLSISSLEPYNKERFNFYQIQLPEATDTSPSVVGFLQIKKGSTFTSNPPLEATKSSTLLKVALKNSTGFDDLRISTDFNGNSFSSPTAVPQSQFSFSEDSKIWAQMLKNNNVLYNFFDITKGTSTFELDITLLNKVPNLRHFSSPGGNLQVNVHARKDKGFGMRYNFGMTRSQYNQLDYYYPSETFEEYYTVIHYTVGSLNYTITKIGTSIPTTTDIFNASFSVKGSNLDDFVPTITGTSDHYQADFLSSKPDFFLSMSLFSPISANYNAVKMPDISQYLNINTLDLKTLKLKKFGVYESDQFSELSLWYKNYHSSFNLNTKSAESNF